MLLLHGYLWWRLVRSTTRPGRVRRGLTAAPVVLGLLPALAIGLRGTLPARRGRPAGLGRLQLARHRLLPLPRPPRPRAGAAARCGPGPGATAARRSAAQAPTGERHPTTVAVRPDSDVMSHVAAPLPRPRAGRHRRRGRAGHGRHGRRTSRTPPPSSGGCRSPSRAWTRRSTGCGSSPSPTPTCRPPTADGGSSGSSRSSTPSGRTSSRSSATSSTASVEELREDVAPLADLVSEQGVFFVTGNHEYFVDTRAWLRHLPTLGVDVLHNERVAIRRGTATFDLAGHRRPDGGVAPGVPGQGADLDAALDGRDDATPVVLLAHQPVHGRAGAGGGGGPAAVRAHPRRAAVALRLRHPARPARRRGALPARRHPAVRDVRAPATGARRCGSAPGRRSPWWSCGAPR